MAHSPGHLRSLLPACAKHLRNHRLYSTTAVRLAASEHLPRVAQPSFWQSLIPKPFRRRTETVNATGAPASKEWNPMTSFIILGILVGSNAINMIAQRREMLSFTRKADAKLALLREVIGKVKNGEEVDVKRALGTGDPKEEAEWEEVVKELESTDMLWEGRKKRAAKQAEKQAGKGSPQAREEPGPTGDERGKEQAEQRRPKFLM